MIADLKAQLDKMKTEVDKSKAKAKKLKDEKDKAEKLRKEVEDKLKDAKTEEEITTLKDSLKKAHEAEVKSKVAEAVEEERAKHK